MRSRDLWWIVLFAAVLGFAWLMQFRDMLGRDTSGAPEGVLDLPDCGPASRDRYAGPFSARDCIHTEYYGRIFHVRFLPPTGADRKGEIAVDYYADGVKRNVLLEQNLAAYDYPLFVRNQLGWFVPVSRADGAHIAVWQWSPRSAEHMIHIGDLPYGAVADVREDYLAVTSDRPPGPWQVTLFQVQDGIEQVGTFTVRGDRYETCRVSAVSRTITAAGLSEDQLKICDVLHANDQGPRAHRDGVPLDFSEITPEH